MDYKKIIPNQELRLKILGLTEFIPDKVMIKLQYWIKTGRKLNLKDTERYNEKIQWYKLYYRDPLMTQCADKYRVREYVTSKGLENILVPLYGAYDDAEDIDFDDLPDEFVLKTNNGSHTNILCDSKSKLDIGVTIETLNSWLTERTAKAGREWAYYNIQPKIICEQYLDVGENNELVDYKFICFDGKVACVFVNAERNSSEGLIFDIYNEAFKKLPYKRKGLRESITDFPKPINYDEMVEIAEILSVDFPHVRVDLYNINGKVYFGEMTFYHASGYVEFEPDEFDFILGNQFELPPKKKEGNM